MWQEKISHRDATNVGGRKLSEQNAFTFETQRQFYTTRHRRKLRWETNDRFNSVLDMDMDNGAGAGAGNIIQHQQYQEYQGTKYG